MPDASGSRRGVARSHLFFSGYDLTELLVEGSDFILSQRVDRARVRTIGRLGLNGANPAARYCSQHILQLLVKDSVRKLMIDPLPRVRSKPGPECLL